MRKLFSVVAIIAVVFWGYSTFVREEKERELRKSTPVIEAEILDLSCGKRDNIKFKVNERIFSQRIYLSNNECTELSNQETIGIKMDPEGNIVFANENYNDWSEAESVSIILLSLFLVSIIVYYGIISERLREKKKNKRK